MSFWSNPIHSITNIFTNPIDAGKNILETALPIAGAVGGGIIGGPLGAAAGAELGGTGSNLLKGESLKESALSSLPDAALAGATDGLLDYAQSSFPDTMNSLGISGSPTPTDIPTDAPADLGATANDAAGGFQPSGTGYNVDSPGADQFAAGNSGNMQFDASGDPVGFKSTLTGPDLNQFSSLQGITGEQAPGLTVGQNIAQGNELAAMKQLGITPMMALAAGGLATSAIEGGGKTGAQQSEAIIGSQEAQTGQQQVNLGTSGQLNPGQQAALQEQLQAGIAGIRSRYASMGMSGSTSEAQAIAGAQQAYAAQIAEMSQQEINTGLTALGQSSSANTALANQQMQSDQGLSQAIAALAGMGGAATATQKAA